MATGMLRDPPPAHPRSGLAVGVVKLGREGSGIRRDAEWLAAALRSQEVARVVELTASLNVGGWRGWFEAARVAARMRRADVTIIPYTRYGLMSPTASRLGQLVILHLGLRRRTVTVLHDVYPPGSPRRSEWWAVTLVLMLSARTVIHSEHERRELPRMPGLDRRIGLIPLPVTAGASPDRDRARAELGVDAGRRVLAIVGWIHPRKNAALAIEALALLPDDVELWLIGGARRQHAGHVGELAALAERRGVSGRVIITGTLPEEEFARRLAAIDVGLCPYTKISASASVSTILAAHRPVLGSDVPFVRELRAISPEVVHAVETLDAPALAAAVARPLARPAPDEAAYDAILERRSTAAIAERYGGLLATVAHRNGKAARTGRS